MERTETYIDRNGWPSGPWDNEPDKIEFRDEDTGYPCLVVRNRSGALCGYVGVGPDHPLYQASYSEPHPSLKMDPDASIGKRGIMAVLCGAKNFREGKISPDVYFDVHGSLTFSDSCEEGGRICHTPEPGEPDNVWWFGFDCAHCDDLMPTTAAFKGFENDVYRDVAYVKSEIASLAQQLKALV